MSLPLPAVERLFERLMATYGREFLARYEGIDLNAIKSSWAHELGGFAGHLGFIAWALENLPPRAPNVIEFRNLCRQAPAEDAPRLDAPKADPSRVAAELAKLEPMRRARGGGGGWDWAHRIVARHAAGDKVSALPLRMAQEALSRKGAA